MNTSTSASISTSSLTPDLLSVQNVLVVMRELQTRLRKERQHIAQTVTPELQEIKVAQFQIDQSQRSILRDVRALLDRCEAACAAANIRQLQHEVAAVEAEALSAGGGRSAELDRPLNGYSSSTFTMETPKQSKQHFALAGAGGSAADSATEGVGQEQLRVLTSAARRLHDDVEALKMNLFQERVTHEERLAVLQASDEDVERRMSLLETTNDVMRSEIQALRGTLHKMTETLEALQQFESHDSAPAQFNRYELERLVAQVDGTVERLRTEHAEAKGKLESLTEFVAKEEVARRETLAGAMGRLVELERAVAADVEYRAHAPFKPNQHDVSSDWLRGQARSGGRPHFSNSTAAAPSTPSAMQPLIATDAVESRKPFYSPLVAAPKLQAILREQDQHTFASSSSRVAADRLRQRRELEATLEQFYRVYNPDKIPDVGRILDEYDGAEAELFAALEVHYGCFGYFSTT